MLGFNVFLAVANPSKQIANKSDMLLPGLCERFSTLID